MAAAPPAGATAAEKEEFKAYLEKTGAVDALTRGSLFLNPTEFIKQHLGAPSAELQELRRENEMLKKQNEELRKQLEELQRVTSQPTA